MRRPGLRKLGIQTQKNASRFALHSPLLHYHNVK